ncbi:AMP-binding protein [Phaeobacter gallaeciensis]|uniref:AMP-binding protein n=1 Tax=Phaeobacter gallaeciensis TaxID=60890 RepID=A0A366X401_9RHOB|nr:AMP-binding protein [Phaeobacter gallaeciensis]RBW58371.1 AMP-binding protein [Phaeobacter gallaeciensis]
MASHFGTGSSPDYSKAVDSFDLDAARSLLSGSFSDGINACVECCDAHLQGASLALDWIRLDGHHETRSFVKLRDEASRFANLLKKQGIQPGDIVAGLLPRTPDLVAVVLGAFRAGAAYQPLFTAFGPKAIQDRLTMSGAKLVVTDLANREKLKDVKGCPPVALIADTSQELVAGDIDFRRIMAAQSTEFVPVLRNGDDLMLMMATSGTTGPAKGVPIPLKALPAFRSYMVEGIDLRPEDVFWNIADPGWAYGLYYAVIGPLLLGHATTLVEGPFSVDSTYDVISRLSVTNFAGAPTAFRLIIASGTERAVQLRDQLRCISSAGEPLNPEVIRWFEAELNAPIKDHYGQTETGMLVNNHHGLEHPVRPGSAGYVMPGYRVEVLAEDGSIANLDEPGQLAVKIAESPLMFFGGYLNKGKNSIENGYYLTGDTVERDEHGCITFVGRNDDVITSSGYRIGPFDVESALIEHPAVTEAAVVGVPDKERTEIVKAVIVLAEGREGNEELAVELKKYVKQRLSAHAYPRICEFVTELPKTPSGKIQRFLLRQASVGAS